MTDPKINKSHVSGLRFSARDSIRGTVEAAIDSLHEQDVVGRIWRKDHTVWTPDPTELSNRLGWLTVTDLMSEQVPALNAFAKEIREAGFQHVVLLGMGCSNLRSEVLRQALGGLAGELR